MAMTCTDCASESIRADSLRRRLDSAEMDIRELEKERAGLLAEVARLKDRTYALAAQVTGIPCEAEDLALSSMAAGWLAELRENPALAIQGLELTLAEHRAGAAQSDMLAKLAMHWSTNNDAATRTRRPSGGRAAAPRSRCASCGTASR